jgi:ankyrin repeat protein
MDVKTAIETGDVMALRQLLVEDPTLADTRIRWGKECQIQTHPLHYVSDMLFNGTLEKAKGVPLVDVLIDAGANVNFQQPGNGETPLIGAASLGAEDVGVRLLTAGANPNLLGRFRETALHWAAIIGEDRLVGGLIERGAAVNVRDDKYKATPLEWALHGWGEPPSSGASGRYHQVVARLVAAGAHVDPAMLKLPKVLDDAAMLSALQNG